MIETKRIAFTDFNKAEVVPFECREPNPMEVTVKYEYTAISSGTERSNISGDPNVNAATPFDPNAPLFPRYSGYSGTGIVYKIGEGVKNVKVGDRVVIRWGTHAEYYTTSCRNVVKIPEGVDFDEAAFALISNFSLGAIRKVRLEIGESLIVMGLGVLGIFSVMLGKAAGACPIIAVDPVAERREYALKMGADYALDPNDENFAKTVKQLTGGGVKTAIEVSGFGKALDQVLDCIQPFGRIALLGCTRDSNFTIDYYRKVHYPGITIVGAHTHARPVFESRPGFWAENDDIAAILKLLKAKRIDYKQLISEVHKPEDAPEVYKRLVTDKNFPVGVLFKWN